MSLFTNQVDVENEVLVNGSAHTQPVSGTITANAGTGTMLVDGSAHTQPVSAVSLPLPTNAAQESGGHLASLDTKTPVQGQTTMANSTPVVIASDQTPISVIPNPATTSTVTRISVGTISTLLSPSDGTKRRVILFSEGLVYIKLGVTASLTSYTYQMPNKASIEVDNFSGEIDAISPAGTVPVQVTELR